MIDVTKRVIKDIVTEKDGESFDVTKVLLVIGTLFYIVATGVHIYFNHTFDFMNWSVGFAGILAAGSAGIKIKESTEQKVVTDPEK